MTTKYYKVPFASSGDVIAIPDEEPVDGSISYESGYGPDYSLNLSTDPDALPVPRQQMNDLFFTLTSNLKAYQELGIHPFITSSDNGGSPFPYYKYATCVYDTGVGAGPEIWMSTNDSNTDTPLSPSGGPGWFKPIEDPLAWIEEFWYPGESIVHLGDQLYYCKATVSYNENPATTPASWGLYGAPTPADIAYTIITTEKSINPLDEGKSTPTGSIPKINFTPEHHHSLLRARFYSPAVRTDCKKGAKFTGCILVDGKIINSGSIKLNNDHPQSYTLEVLIEGGLAKTFEFEFIYKTDKKEKAFSLSFDDGPCQAIFTVEEIHRPNSMRKRAKSVVRKGK